MDAIALLKRQHKEVKARIEESEEAEGSVKAEDTEDLLREAVEEHLSVKRLIADAMACPPGDPQFEAKVCVLGEQVIEHAEEEEKELFPKVKKLFSKEQLEDLGMVMEEMANELEEESEPRRQVLAETNAPAPL